LFQLIDLPAVPTAPVFQVAQPVEVGATITATALVGRFAKQRERDVLAIRVLNGLHARHARQSNRRTCRSAAAVQASAVRNDFGQQ
jgi:hypothetical protein